MMRTFGLIFTSSWIAGMPPITGIIMSISTAAIDARWLRLVDVNRFPAV